MLKYIYGLFFCILLAGCSSYGVYNSSKFVEVGDSLEVVNEKMGTEATNIITFKRSGKNYTKLIFGENSYNPFNYSLKQYHEVSFVLFEGRVISIPN